MKTLPRLVSIWLFNQPTGNLKAKAWTTLRLRYRESRFLKGRRGTGRALTLARESKDGALEARVQANSGTLTESGQFYRSRTAIIKCHGIGGSSDEGAGRCVDVGGTGGYRQTVAF